MTKSQKIAQRGFRILAQHGWPDEVQLELSQIFMEAGAMHLVETLEANKQRKEELIQRVQVQ